jgi:large subunit ribosomal protein L18
MDKKASRLRRARQTRAKIAELKVNRLAVHRTNLHIYATIISPDAKVLASASTAEAEIRKELADKTGKGGNAAAAALVVGKRVAEKALKAGIAEVAFDRSGFRYHGRVKAVADAAREAGLKF